MYSCLETSGIFPQDSGIPPVKLQLYIWILKIVLSVVILPRASGSGPFMFWLSYSNRVPMCFQEVKMASGSGVERFVLYRPRFLSSVIPAHSAGMVPEILFLLSCRLFIFVRLPILAGNWPPRPVVTARKDSRLTRFPISEGSEPVRLELLPRFREVRSVKEETKAGRSPLSPNPLKFNLVSFPFSMVTPPHVSMGSSEFQLVFLEAVQFAPSSALYSPKRAVRRGFSF